MTVLLFLWTELMPNCLDGSVKLKGFLERMKAIPSIAKWFGPDSGLHPYYALE